MEVGLFLTIKIQEAPGTKFVQGRVRGGMGCLTAGLDLISVNFWLLIARLPTSLITP